jgi:CubicO group peptidase (beta-lactamase class C family)
MKHVLNTIFFSIILIFQICGQSDSIEIIIKNYMQKQKIPGLSIGIAKNGTTIMTKGFGYANLEHFVPVTEKTVFRLASISKQFFATAILKLEQDGKLSLEDNLNKYFSDAPDFWAAINIKHLLTHTSGLVREAPGYQNFELKSDLTVIKSAYPLPLEFPTGSKYQYCNLGYFILAEIITQVSKMPWQDYIKSELFDPAGMKDTYLTEFYPIIPHRASGYVHNNGKYVNAEPMISIRPSGGFLSTTTDILKWEGVLLNKNIILSQENWNRLWYPHFRTSEKQETFYGYGWVIDTVDGHKTIGHSGGNIGFRTHYLRYVDKGLSIVVLTNSNNAAPIDIIKEVGRYLLK